MPPNPDDLKHKVEALQRNVAGLLQLLGSHDPDKRWEFWEILKGITTPAEFALVEHEIAAINTLVTHAGTSAQALFAATKLVRHDKAIGH
jgi:hypothetical protein